MSLLRPSHSSRKFGRLSSPANCEILLSPSSNSSNLHKLVKLCRKAVYISSCSKQACCNSLGIDLRYMLGHQSSVQVRQRLFNGLDCSASLPKGGMPLSTGIPLTKHVFLDQYALQFRLQRVPQCLTACCLSGTSPADGVLAEWRVVPCCAAG